MKPAIGMRVRFVHGSLVSVTTGDTGTIDMVNSNNDAFVVALDRGGVFGWTTFKSWEPVPAAGHADYRRGGDVMCTADTITDAQIRELHDRAVARFERGVDDETDREVIKLIRLALVPHMWMPMIDDEARAYVRKSRARCAEILNARAEPACDFHDSHDLAADRPTGNRCEAPATHRIEWADGRYSFGCSDHLTIDDSATVKPIRAVPLTANTKGTK